jgi:hypothetical protein
MVKGLPALDLNQGAVKIVVAAYRQMTRWLYSDKILSSEEFKKFQCFDCSKDAAGSVIKAWNSFNDYVYGKLEELEVIEIDD